MTIENATATAACCEGAVTTCCGAEAPTMPVAEIPEEQRQRCEVWTRVMGYHRPVASFNQGKKGEYAERTAFVEPGDVA